MIFKLKKSTEDIANEINELYKERQRYNERIDKLRGQMFNPSLQDSAATLTEEYSAKIEKIDNKIEKLSNKYGIDVPNICDSYDIEI